MTNFEPDNLLGIHLNDDGSNTNLYRHHTDASKVILIRFSADDRMTDYMVLERTAISVFSMVVGIKQDD